MGKYTAYNDASVDLEISNQVNTILSVILDFIPEDIESIYLSGGFGRGEGSVRFGADGKVVPMKDFDILVVLKNSVDQQIKKKVNEAVYEALGFSNVESGLFRFSDFVVDLSFTKLSNLKSFPDISIYELKTTGSLLYGQDTRKDIPWRPEDIPIASGCRLLFEKMTGLIGHFPENFGVGMSERSKELLFYECNKSYVEIGTALCLLFKCYEPSYSRRKELFRANFPKMQPFCDNMPELPDLVEQATDFKLKPDFNKVTIDPLEIWFKARDTLLSISKFYLDTYLNLGGTDFLRSQKIMKRLNKAYFAHISSTLSKRFGKMSPLIQPFANNAFNAYMNYQYSKNLKRNKHPLPKNVFSSPFTSINARLYSTAPQILLSIQKDLKIDQCFFDAAVANLKSLCPNRQLESFSDLRSAYLTVYRCLPFH
jgi:hypothetical protein